MRFLAKSGEGCSGKHRPSSRIHPANLHRAESRCRQLYGTVLGRSTEATYNSHSRFFGPGLVVSFQKRLFLAQSRCDEAELKVDPSQVACGFIDPGNWVS